VKLFKNTDFAYHKVNVVFWQTDEYDEPAMITEPYPKAFTAANIAKEQAFYASDLGFTVCLTEPATGGSAMVAFTLSPDDSFPKVFESAAHEVFAAEIEAATKDTPDKKKAVKRFLDALRAEAEWTHRHYVQDDEYIPYGEDIEAFLNREIAKPIIRWKETEKDGKTILGYEILPNKYFYRYQPPTPAKDLLAEFWRLEEEAEGMLKRVAQV
jgi:type I restriction enzyme M protein